MTSAALLASVPGQRCAAVPCLPRELAGRAGAGVPLRRWSGGRANRSCQQLRKQFVVAQVNFFAEAKRVDHDAEVSAFVGNLFLDLRDPHGPQRSFAFGLGGGEITPFVAKAGIEGFEVAVVDHWLSPSLYVHLIQRTFHLVKWKSARDAIIFAAPQEQ